MAYDTTIPVAGQSPGVFPTQANENFGRLKTIITADHQFNDSTAANDGYHKVTRWVNQGGAIGDNTPTGIASTAQFYTKSLQYRKEGGGASTRQVLMQQPGNRAAGNEEVAVGAAPIRAAVSITAGGLINGAALNVSSITNLGSQSYRVNFEVATPMPNTKYIVVATAAPGGALPVFVQTTAKLTTSCTVQFASQSGAATTAGVDVIVLGGWVE